MAKKLTYKEVKQFIESNTLFILDQNFYVNSRVPLKLKCSCCNKIIDTMNLDVIKSRIKNNLLKCHICEDYDKQYERIKKYFKEYGDGCELIIKPYKYLKQDKLEIVCPKCNNIFKCKYTSFRAKKNKCCSKCAKEMSTEKQKFDLLTVKNIIETNSSSKLLSTEYKNLNSLLLLKCSCGNEFNVRLRNFYKGKRTCDVCSNRGTQWNYDLVKQYVETNTNCRLISTEYTNIDDYNLIFTCNDCEKEFSTSFYNFKSGKCYCNNCSNKTSNGERILENLLIINNIKYIPQFMFENCKRKRSLKFDYYLPNYNTILEVDGVQHYKPISVFGGEEQFLYQLENDKIKNEYCKDNNINLIRIFYDSLNKDDFINRCNIHINSLLSPTNK